MNCFNGERFLGAAIDSIYAQTFSDWEIIFWDNASTDRSQKITSMYDVRLKYFRSPITTPLGIARNNAIKKASGKYIAFLDCDDVYEQDKLEKQVKLMNSYNYAMCYSGAIVIDKNSKIIKRIVVRNTSGLLIGQLLRKYEIVMASVMLRHDVLTNGNYCFDKRLKYSPDYNLFMKIAAINEVCVIKDSLVRYRLVENSLTSQSNSIAALEARVTLDWILDKNPHLKNSYKNEIDWAYKKLHYYEAIAYLKINDRKSALNELKLIFWDDIRYSIFYFLIFIRVPTNALLKYLGRLNK